MAPASCPALFVCCSSHRPLGSVSNLRFELSGLRQRKVSIFGSQRTCKQATGAKLPFSCSFGFLSLLNAAVLLTAVQEYPAICPEGVCQPHLALPNLAIMYLHHVQGHPVIFMAPLFGSPPHQTQLHTQYFICCFIRGHQCPAFSGLEDQLAGPDE